MRGDVDLADERAPARDDCHEAVAFELLDRLAHRCAPDAEALHQVVVAQQRPGRDLRADDRLAQQVIRLLRAGAGTVEVVAGGAARDGSEGASSSRRRSGRSTRSRPARCCA